MYTSEERMVQKAIGQVFDDLHSLAQSQERIAIANERIADALELLFYNDEDEDDDDFENYQPNPEQKRKLPRLDEHI